MMYVKVALLLDSLVMSWGGATDDERPRVAARGLRMLRVGPASPTSAAPCGAGGEDGQHRNAV